MPGGCLPSPPTRPEGGGRPAPRHGPRANLLWTSCKAGPASPQPFYLRYGFVLTGGVKWGEDLLRLDLGDAGV